MFRVLSFFPEGKEIPIRSRWIAGGKKRGRGSDENKISRACFSYFGFFSFFSSRSLSAKVNGACARCAEKVMDRALNVGSHGIWENAGGGEGREGGRGGEEGPVRGANRLPPATTSPFSKQLGDERCATTIMRAFDATSSLVSGRRNSPTLLTFEHDSAKVLL